MGEALRRRRCGRVVGDLDADELSGSIARRISVERVGNHVELLRDVELRRLEGLVGRAARAERVDERELRVRVRLRHERIEEPDVLDRGRRGRRARRRRRHAIEDDRLKDQRKFGSRPVAVRRVLQLRGRGEKINVCWDARRAVVRAQVLPGAGEGSPTVPADFERVRIGRPVVLLRVGQRRIMLPVVLKTIK